MKKVLLVLACFFSIALVEDLVDARSRCVGIRPVCSPGKNPICLCENEWTISKCKWICADLGAKACQDLPDDECGDDPLCPIDE